MKKRIELARARMHAGEVAGGQATTEYIIVLGVLIGLGVVLVAFRDAIGDAITDAGEAIVQTFTDITTPAGS